MTFCELIFFLVTKAPNKRCCPSHHQQLSDACGMKTNDDDAIANNGHCASLHMTPLLENGCRKK
jgi:hypothetical protein